MPSERQRRIRELFDAVHELDAGAQQEYLVRSCGKDHELAGAVWKLLLARNRSAGFLDTPVVERREAGREPAEPGMRIGPYKILKKLGSGGMGSVYQALRADEVFQRVFALKVIHPELVHSSLLQSFYAERQILAKLDHPNIARIVDGGTTSERFPYFVMDFVDGLPLLTFCSEKNLDIRDRLQLFAQVCAAVDYLHKNGVIHCDLKPSNTLVDKSGSVKLVDFGIAQLTGGAEGRRDLPLLTPGYASPEQLRGQRATPASDVYSLGVSLYELLSGHRPFETKTTEELIQAAGSVDPPPPSAAASGDSDHPRSVLRGDLDAIVLRAIQREPVARYESALALSDDIGRYLGGRPIQAKRGGFLYRSSKLVRRRGRETIVALIALVLVGVLAWQTLLLRQRYLYASARERALEQRLEEMESHARNNRSPSVDLAQTQTADLRNLADAYQTSFSDAIRVWPGMNDRRRRLLGNTSTYLADVARRIQRNPPALEQLVNAWLQVANVEGNPDVPNLGDRPAARQSLQQAAAALETLVETGVDSDALERLEKRVQFTTRVLNH